MTIETVTAIGVVVTAGITTYIAIQQHRLEKQRLRMDLYEKRYEVFVAVMAFLSKVLAVADTDIDSLRELGRNTREANFLFGDDVPAFIKAVHDRGVDLMTSKQTFAPMPKGPERNAAVEKNTEHLKWLTSQFDPAVEIFGRYLKIAEK